MGIISTETKDIKTIPEIDNKELNQNKLNIYLIGNKQQIEIFGKKENLTISNQGNEFMNIENDFAYPLYEWIFLQENYSEKTMDNMIEDIIQKSKRKDNCNMCLILIDNEKNIQDIYISIDNYLNKTNKNYKPFVLLACKKHFIDNKEKDSISDNMNIGENNIICNEIKIDLDNENSKISDKTKCVQNPISIKDNIVNVSNDEDFKEGLKKNLIDIEKEKDDSEKDKSKLEDKKNNDSSKNCNHNINEYNKLSNPYLELIYYSEGDYSEIEKKIYSLYCYFNNIGDIYSIINLMLGQNKFYLDNQSNNKSKATLNILVIGRPGGGKSTLINLLLNERKAREGIGLSITKLYSKYIHNEYPITFIDTPGFETENDLNRMIGFLDQSNIFFGDGKNKIHLILYIINSCNERSFIGEEKKLIKHIYKNTKIPIFFILTRAENIKNVDDRKAVLTINLYQDFPEKKELSKNIYCCQLLNERDGIYKQFGVDELLKSIQDYFKIEINNINIINDNLKNKQFFLGHSPLYHQILLSSLNKYESFEKYLLALSNSIIENYKNLVKQEEKKKYSEKNKNQKLNKIIAYDQINNMLVKHLAFELDGDFSENNINNIIFNFSYSYEKEKNNSFSYSHPNIKDKKLKEDNIKSIETRTEELGKYAQNIFFVNLKKKGFHNYLNEIIIQYQKAIDSLTNLNKKNK